MITPETPPARSISAAASAPVKLRSAGTSLSRLNAALRAILCPQGQQEPRSKQHQIKRITEHASSFPTDIHIQSIAVLVCLVVIVRREAFFLLAGIFIFRVIGVVLVVIFVVDVLPVKGEA